MPTPRPLAEIFPRGEVEEMASLLRAGYQIESYNSFAENRWTTVLVREEDRKEYSFDLGLPAMIGAREGGPAMEIQLLEALERLLADEDIQAGGRSEG